LDFMHTQGDFDAGRPVFKSKGIADSDAAEWALDSKTKIVNRFAWDAAC